MSQSGRKVKYARLHDAIQVPNLGAVGPTMNSQFTPTDKQYDMVIEEPFVIATTTAKTKAGQTQAYELLIPLTSFALLQPEPKLAVVEPKVSSKK